MEYEEWRPVVINGEETKYEVSDQGRIRNLTTGYILKPSLARGYYKCNIYHDGVKYQKKLHRMVAEAFIPNPDNLPQVDHINTIKTDNRAENLEWVTAQQNTRRAHDLGLCNGRIGEKSPYHKYTETEIRRVCELLEDGSYDFDEISNITGLDKNVFRRVLHRINWTHISKEYDFSKMMFSPIHKRHRKQKKHTNLHNCIDRAIDSGMERNNIIAVLVSHGLPRDVARGLYDARKKKVDNHESIVQCTVYIDEGIDIFKKRSTTIDNHYDNTEPVYVICDDV